MPICAPVRLIALWPSEVIAIAISATLTCSPVDSSMSISRAGGSSVICLARSTSTIGVLAHRADDHDDLVAFQLGADGLSGRGEDLLAVGHAGAAELLDDDRHGGRGTWGWGSDWPLWPLAASAAHRKLSHDMRFAERFQDGRNTHWRVVSRAAQVPLALAQKSGIMTSRSVRRQSLVVHEHWTVLRRFRVG